MQKSELARDDWVYPNIPKTLDDAVKEKLKNDEKFKKLGIIKTNDFYTYVAQKYIEEE